MPKNKKEMFFYFIMSLLIILLLCGMGFFAWVMFISYDETPRETYIYFFVWMMCLSMLNDIAEKLRKK